jgi:hypothetical protein
LGKKPSVTCSIYMSQTVGSVATEPHVEGKLRIATAAEP